MVSLRIMLGLCIAVSFDIALGLLLVHGFAAFMHHDVSWIGYGFAAFLSLLPDFDVVVQRVVEGKVTGTHKKTSISHKPLVMLPLVSLALLPFSAFWAGAALLCLMAHYVHDTLEEGPGIPWLAPFSPQRYWLRKTPDGWCAELTDEELAALYTATMEEWLEETYLRVNAASVLGVMALAFALALISF